MQKTGFVQRKTVAKGSKSERSAVVLVAPEGEFILRRAGGNPFVDRSFDSFIGRKVSCEGVMLAGSTFEVRTLDAVGDSAGESGKSGS